MISITKGTNNESVLSINRALVIQYLRKNGICSRAQISKAMGLTGASISKIISAMIDACIVQETGFIDGEKGRRSVGIALNVDTYKVIGIKLSRRSYSMGVFDIGGNQYETLTRAIDMDVSLGQVAEQMLEVAHGYLDAHKDIYCVGMSVPGPFNVRTSEILMTTEMQGWVDIPLKRYFDHQLPVPIFFEHDANAGALAEWWLCNHSEKGYHTMAHLLLSEGVGAGIIYKGNVFRGSRGIAGEIGHVSIHAGGERCMCGNYGCLELYCSALAFAKQAQKAATMHPNSILSLAKKLTAEEVFVAARQGDDLASSLVRNVGRYIGYGVVNLVHAYDPDVVVLSNIMTGGGELMLQSIRETVHERVFAGLRDKVNIQYSQYEGDLILYGGAAVAIDRFLNNPMRFLKVSTTR